MVSAAGLEVTVQNTVRDGVPSATVEGFNEVVTCGVPMKKANTFIKEYVMFTRM